MNRIISRLFSGLQRAYLVRAYVIGGAFFVFLLIMASYMPHKRDDYFLIILMLVSTLLFPFSKLVWDELKRLVLGQTIIVMPIIILYPLKLFANMFLWFAAILVAPFGMIYLWIRTGRAAAAE